MSLDREQQPEPLTHERALLDSYNRAGRPAREHKVGLEHEKLLFHRLTGAPVAYEGAEGIQALLEAIAPHGYTAFREAPERPPIALTRGIEAISLEPGGQFELSGSPFPTAREAHAENLRHVAELKAAAGPLQLLPVALGYRPNASVDEMSWMPKSRYRMMREVLPERGGLARDMMLLTATGQVSLDWVDEADCAKKVTLVARLTPVLVALYANSPLRLGKPSGFQSFRSHVWSDVDPARCGYFPAMLDGTFSFQSYVDWALAAPLLFLRRRGEYLRPKITFRQLLENGFEQKPALASDWVDHLSTLFPEVRIKRVLEVRGADCASVAMTGGLGALFRGLLYDAQALSDAAQIVPQLGYAEHLEFHVLAQRQGLHGSLRGKSLATMAQEMVALARAGLERLDPADAPLLDVLAAQAERGESPAVDVLAAWESKKDVPGFLEKFAL